MSTLPAPTITCTATPMYLMPNRTILMIIQAYDNYHVVPSLTIPTGSAIGNGKTVMIDYYGVIPAYNSQFGACLSHPNITTYLSINGNVKFLTILDTCKLTLPP